MAPEQRDLHARLMRGLVRLVRNVGSYHDSRAALGSIVRDLVDELGLEGAALWRMDGARLTRECEAGAAIDEAFAARAVDHEALESGRMAWPLRVGGHRLGVLAIRGDIPNPLAALVVMLAGRCAHILNDARRAHTQRTLLEGLSHELRAPLQSLLGHVDLLASGSFGALTGEQAGAVETIAHSAERILAVTHDVLQIARIDSGKEQAIRGEVRLADVLRQEIDAARPLADRKGLAIELDCPAGLVLVSDGRKIGRVVTNLLSNALKYTSRGTVTVRGGKDASGHFVEVADTGTGIPPESQSSVFDAYVRATGSADGTGLGLPISRRLAELLGGSLTLRSEPERGTTVRLSLP